MNFDDFLEILGEFGPYQKQKFVLIFVAAFYSVISTLGVVFYGAVPLHHCKIPRKHLEIVASRHGNVTTERLLDLNVPYTKSGKRSGCTLYRIADIASVNSTVNSADHNTSQEFNATTIQTPVLYSWNHVESDSSLTNGTLSRDLLNITVSLNPPLNDTSSQGTRYSYPCPDGRVYNNDEFDATIVSEFDLTCENAWQVNTCNTIFFGGKLLAVLSSGILSDRFGRRPVFLVSVILLAISGVALAFSPNMAVFCVLYVIQGASDSSMYQALYIMGMELVGKRYRKSAALGMAICFGLGHSLLALEAYFLTNWRHLALVACSPGVIIIFFYFFTNESVRWLLSRGRHEEAQRIITKAARINKVKLEDDAFGRLFKEGDEEKIATTHSPLDLFRTWKRASLTIKLAFVRYCYGVGYYLLALSAQTLGGSMYLNFALIGAADIPIVILSLFILDYVGRRKFLCGTISLGGLACLITGFIPKGLHWLIVVTAVIGKMMLCAAGAVTDLVISETYPTVIRQIGFSVCISFGRLGGMTSPQVLYLRHIYEPLPFIITGALALVGGVVALFLPETFGKSLVQTIEAWDKELGRKSSPSQSKHSADETDADEVELESLKA